MAAFNLFLEQHHRLILGTLMAVIVLFVTACTFHDTLPICHYVFGCDHAVHPA